MDNAPGQEPDPQPQLPPCPHCGQSVPRSASHCPNCGNILATPKQWPPRPAGQPQDGPPEPPSRAEVRRLVNEGMAFGCGGFIGAWILVIMASGWLIERFPGIEGSIVGAAIGDFAPAAVFVAVYFFMKSERPYTARGLGYAILVALPLALGALASCSHGGYFRV